MDRILEGLGNSFVSNLVKGTAELCQPESVKVLTGSEEDKEYVRAAAIKNGEEISLCRKGATVHFDGERDLARARADTKILVPSGRDLGDKIKTLNRENGLAEILGFLKGGMKGKEMFVSFFCLGPENSPFSIPALEISDSAYVMHSSFLLYRRGFEEFMRLKGDQRKNFFHFVHSAGRLDSRHNSADIGKRRIYIDPEGQRVLSVNNQYGGNSIGLKKHAMRLAINKGHQEGWLCEHMFLVGSTSGSGEEVYVGGAFPSLCGKTSTSVLGSILGDDIIYIKNINGKARAVNVEAGMFGIIDGLNPKDDPLLYKAITSAGEIIFSNVLEHKGEVYWNMMGKEIPRFGENFSGFWFNGKKGADGSIIPASHKNARFVMGLSELATDSNLHNPLGVPLGALVFGARDKDTVPPLVEAFNWQHGTFLAAGLETEATEAVTDSNGKREINIMANLDFLSISPGEYIQNYLEFGRRLREPPRIFMVNYFLEENGKGLNDRPDKRVWIKWIAERVKGRADAIKTPIGFVPKYEDLAGLFKQELGKDYRFEDYQKQFRTRKPALLARLKRVEEFYASERGVPREFYIELGAQRERLLRE